jgi:iron-sulfur cluster repair protein YtfE (RIC family)
MTTTPRFDPFGPIHKAIRFALTQLLCRMGSTDFREPGRAEAIAKELELVTALSDDHLRTEEAIVLPALRSRLAGDLATVDAAHRHHGRLVSELRASAAAVVSVPAERRAVAGRTLYLHFGTFVSESLAHMSDEELVVSPLLERFFTDDELRSLHASVMAMLTLEEHARGARFLLPALSPRERVALVEDAIATLPREAVLALLEIARPTMQEGDLAELLALTGLAA